MFSLLSRNVALLSRRCAAQCSPLEDEWPAFKVDMNVKASAGEAKRGQEEGNTKEIVMNCRKFWEIAP